MGGGSKEIEAEGGREGKVQITAFPLPSPRPPPPPPSAYNNVFSFFLISSSFSNPRLSIRLLFFVFLFFLL